MRKFRVEVVATDLADYEVGWDEEKLKAWVEHQLRADALLLIESLRVERIDDNG